MVVEAVQQVSNIFRNTAETGASNEADHLQRTMTFITEHPHQQLRTVKNGLGEAVARKHHRECSNKQASDQATSKGIQEK